MPLQGGSHQMISQNPLLALAIDIFLSQETRLLLLLLRLDAVVAAAAAAPFAAGLFLCQRLAGLL